MSDDTDKDLGNFRSLATAHGQSFLDGDESISNRLNEKLLKLSTQLQSNWPVNESGLVTMLNDDDYFVQLWAAFALRTHREKDALSTLKRLRSKRGIVGLSARVHLDSCGR